MIFEKTDRGRNCPFFDRRRFVRVLTNQASVGEEGPNAVQLCICKRGKHFQRRLRYVKTNYTPHLRKDWILLRRTASWSRTFILRTYRLIGKISLLVPSTYKILIFNHLRFYKFKSSLLKEQIKCYKIGAIFFIKNA